MKRRRMILTGRICIMSFVPRRVRELCLFIRTVITVVLARVSSRFYNINSSNNNTAVTTIDTFFERFLPRFLLKESKETKHKPIQIDRFAAPNLFRFEAPLCLQ